MPMDLPACPQCGNTNRPQARFCAQCGAPLYQAQATEQPPKRSRRLWIAAAGIVLSCVCVSGALALVALFGSVLEDDDPESDGIWPSNLPAASETSYAADIGPAGGVISVPPTDAGIAGVQLTIPAGALLTSARITLEQVDAAEAPSPADLVYREPGFGRALSDSMMLAGVHPFVNPSIQAESMQIIGPALHFEPSGMAFAAPARVTIPGGLLSAAGGDSVLPMLRSEDGSWTVAGQVERDPRTGTLSYDVPHFTDNIFVKVAKNWWNGGPLTVQPDPVEVRNALDQLPPTPHREFMRAGFCANVDPVFRPESIPDMDTILEYLAWRSARIASPRNQAEDDLEAWLRAQWTDNRELRQASVQSAAADIPLAMVYRKSLELTDGDVFMALVVAHNVLRDERQTNNRLPDPVHDMIENFRGDGGDERGAHYHLFGVAIYSFAYEHARASGELGMLDVSPEVASLLEERYVSGDIFSDTMEYAVDIKGAWLGAELYWLNRGADPGGVSHLTTEAIQSTLQGYRNQLTCGDLLLKGRYVDLTGSAFAPYVTANSIELSFSSQLYDGPVDGEITLQLEIPVETLLGLDEAGSPCGAESINGVECGDVASGTASGDDDTDFSDFNDPPCLADGTNCDDDDEQPADGQEEVTFCTMSYVFTGTLVGAYNTIMHDLDGEMIPLGEWQPHADCNGAEDAVRLAARLNESLDFPLSVQWVGVFVGETVTGTVDPVNAWSEPVIFEADLVSVLR